MITTCDFHNVDGTTVYALNSTIAPLSDFDVQVTQRTDLSRTKPDRPGLNPTRTQRGQMEIHVEGNLMSDTSANYIAARLTLVNALFGAAGAVITNRKLGTLVMRFDGQSEDWNADVTITAFQAPLKANYPALTSYLVTFVSWLPYFVGASSGTKYNFA